MIFLDVVVFHQNLLQSKALFFIAFLELIRLNYKLTKK